MSPQRGKAVGSDERSWGSHVLPPLFRVLGAAWLATVAACGSPVGVSLSTIPFEKSSKPEWFDANAPLLTEYLKTLPLSAVGQPLKGIRLSDGELWLADSIYLGEPDGLPEGLGARLIDESHGVVAYLWLEKGADPFALRRCESGAHKGLKALRAGGGVYAWQLLRAEHGLVYSVCPPDEWLTGLVPSPAEAVGAGEVRR